MEHPTNPSQFTIPSNLKALGDRNENIIVYYHHSVADSANKPSPFEIIRVIPTAHKGLITLLRPFFQASTNKHYLISSSFDKDVKLWDLSTEPATLLDSLHHPKKVDFGFVDIENARLTYSDKTGDIFELTFQDLKLSKPEMTQANMDTLSYFDRHTLSDGTDLAVLTDEYEKIKFLKYPEIYHILNIFSPYKDTNFHNVLNLSPNALVVRLSNGQIDLISLKSMEENEYIHDKLDLSAKIERKNIYEIYRVNADYFVAVDEFFTVIVVVRISENHVVEDKIVDISGLGILKDQKDHDTKRFIEAERDGESLVLYFKYERSQDASEGENGNKDENEIKLHDGVYVKKLVVNL